MPTITRFEEIDPWVTTRELTRMVYALTDEGSFAKDFGLRNQIELASVSIMSNIAEGFESRTQAKFIDYLGHAKASAGEVRCQLYIAMDLKYVSQEQFKQVFDVADKTSRQLARFISCLETHPQSRRVREESPEYDI